MLSLRSCRRQSSVCAASTFRSAVSSALLDCRDMREGAGEEALSRARVCAASRILISVASFLWRAPTREDRTVCSCRRRRQGRGSWRVAFERLVKVIPSQ
jgi:hypothetical protein